MSERDSFLEEVTEEVRRDRLFRLWRRYGPWGISTIVVAVAALGGWELLQDRAEQEARVQMDTLLTIQESEDPSELAESLEAFAAESDAGYALVARFHAATQWLDAGETDRAVDIYDAIAKAAETPPQYRELAALKAIMASADQLAADDYVLALRRHTEENAIYRPIARELLAGALLAAGDPATALEEIDALLDTSELSFPARSRLRELRQVAEGLNGGGGAEPESDG